MDQSGYRFSAFNLASVADQFGADDFTDAIEAGFGSSDFPRLVCLLAAELRILYELTDQADLTPPSSDSHDDVIAFLYELSSFLTLLDCPHDSLCCGGIEQRLASSANRARLIIFLLDELRCARILAAERLKRPSTSTESPLASLIKSAAATVGIAPISGNQTPREYIQLIGAKADAMLCAQPSRPSPIFKAKLDPYQWPAIEATAKRLATDFQLRNLYILKRLDVTINSFLWSSEVRKKEAEILAHFRTRRDRIAHFEPPRITELLAASEQLIVIRKAASGARVVKRSRLAPSAHAERPADRGGRTDEVYLPPPESFAQQQFQREHGGRGGRGGGDRGGGRQDYGGRVGRGGYTRGGGGGYGNDGGYGRGGHGSGGGGTGRSYEQQARQEYEDRSGGRGRGGGGQEYRGRGRGRGGRQHY